MNPTLAYILLVAQISLWLLWLYRQRPKRSQDDSPLLLLFASQSGQAEILAHKLADNLAVNAQSLDGWCAHHPISALRGKTLIIIASTSGEGNAPDNAVRFTRALEKCSEPLIDTRFHLLALGDKRYPNFCGFGLALAEALQKLQAHAETPVITVDNLDPQAIADWHNQLAAHLNISVNVEAQAPSYAATLVARNQLNPESETPLYHIRLDCPEIPTETSLIEVSIPQEGNSIRRQYSVAAIAPDGSRGLDLIIRQQRHTDGTPGVGSHYLTQTLALGDNINIRALTHHPANIPDAPCSLILVASGSGLAGILGILMQMEARYPAHIHHLEHWFIFGERNPEHDRIYDPCLEQLQQQGVITWLDRSYSRGDVREYAYQVLEKQEGRLKAQMNKGAIIYTCGSANKIGASIADSLKTLLGNTRYEQLSHEHRIRFDTY